MSDVTRILSAIEQGDPKAAEKLLPLVYKELRQLAARRLARENPGQTLDATALVHEAYLRLVQTDDAEAPGLAPQGAGGGKNAWQGRAHFFAAAAEAMRRILVENARRKKRLRHGGDRRRVSLHPNIPGQRSPDELLAVDDAITKLAADDAEAAELVKLHFYAGLSIEESADVLEISRASAYRQWTYARAWLQKAFGDGKPAPGT
jgi:RNA polymerase sigma factor (sigma-70 family)